MKHTSSLLHDLILFVLIPPIGTFAWLLFSRGWTGSLGTSDNTTVKGWTKSGFWIVLALLYIVCFAMMIYKYFFMQ